MPKLTPTQVSRLLRARGLKASPAELEQLTQMMNEDLGREAQNKAVDKFFEEFWKPVRKEQRVEARRKKK